MIGSHPLNSYSVPGSWWRSFAYIISFNSHLVVATPWGVTPILQKMKLKLKAISDLLKIAQEDRVKMESKSSPGHKQCTVQFSAMSPAANNTRHILGA